MPREGMKWVLHTEGGRAHKIPSYLLPVIGNSVLLLENVINHMAIRRHQKFFPPAVADFQSGDFPALPDQKTSSTPKETYFKVLGPNESMPWCY